jgi:hypothetical protein
MTQYTCFVNAILISQEVVVSKCIVPSSPNASQKPAPTSVEWTTHKCCNLLIYIIYKCFQLNDSLLVFATANNRDEYEPHRHNPKTTFNAPQIRG